MAVPSSPELVLHSSKARRGEVQGSPCRGPRYAPAGEVGRSVGSHGPPMRK